MSERELIRMREGYRQRLRPDTNCGYNIIFDRKDEGIKIVETSKPPKKRKKKVVFKDEETGAAIEQTVSNESDRLKLSILDSNDSKEVRMTYNRQKVNKAAFIGAYSDRHTDQDPASDGDEEGKTRKLKSKSKKKKKTMDKKSPQPSVENQPGLGSPIEDQKSKM